MGNDGGSIPDRRDLVRNKPKAEQADKANQTRAKWFFCALSKRPLLHPIVACALGKIYNKDAILEYLIDSSAYGDGEEICGHIRSLKDVKTLTLTLNPALSATTSSDSPADRAQFVCPLTMKEMNGSQPFVYLKSCGCVFSLAGLKALTTASSTPPAKDEKDKEKTAVEDVGKEFDVCPQCATKYDRVEDVITLNPALEEEQKLRAAMERRRLLESAKKSKKRKGAKDDGDAQPPTKKKPMPSMNPNIIATSRAVVSSLAMEEAKRKAEMSAAVKSLYTNGDAPKRKETFMTMGTFTRYA